MAKPLRCKSVTTATVGENKKNYGGNDIRIALTLHHRAMRSNARQGNIAPVASIGNAQRRKWTGLSPPPWFGLVEAGLGSFRMAVAPG